MKIVKAMKSFIQPYSGGGGNRTNGSANNQNFSKIGSNLKVFDTSPGMQKMFQGYFGFDIGNLGNFSIEDFKKLAKSAEEARQFEKYKDVILKNIQDYISGVVTFNQLVAQCAKDGAEGMKKIDQSTFDTWLAYQGYQQNAAQLSKKVQTQQQRFNRDREDFNSYEEFTLEKYLENAAYKMQRKKQKFLLSISESRAKDEEFDINSEWQRFAAKERQQTERDLADLLNYGEIRYRNPDGADQRRTVEVQQKNGGVWKGVGKFFDGI
jgi:hypothetical protein